MYSSSLKQKAAARSAARMKERSSPPPPEIAPPDPAGVLKTSPSGTRYRVYTIPLADLPKFLEREGFETKIFFHFKPEENKQIEDPEARHRSGFVLGVRRKGEKDIREL